MAGRVTYHGGLVTDGLILHLDAARKPSYPGNGTTWYDLTSTSATGTLNNGVGHNKDNTNGGLTFDGTDQDIQGTFDYTFTTGYTVDIWLYIDPRETYPDDEGLWRLNGPSGYRVNLRRRNIQSNSWRYEGTGPNGNIGSEGMVIGAPTDGVWSHLVCSYDGETGLKGYHNSILKRTNSIDLGAIPITSFQIGRNSNSPFLQGTVAEFRVYNRQLSDDEVLQNYNALKGRFGL